MDYHHFAALVAFAFVSTVTPGPNNIMLMTSGANVGFLRTIPHMLGIIFGFSFMVILVGIGLVGVFQSYPVLHQVLQVISIGYLIHLAILIARSKPSHSDKNDYQPMSFLSAAGFQWVNPKGWTMAITTVSIYNTTTDWRGIALISLVFAVVNIPSVSIWTYAGKQLQAFLQQPAKMKWFNYGMAALLLASLLQVL
ncbi:LysE family translocator [Photobacterium lutimaris]|uniref:Lysine transporter LysE n=1 Tax=Photobacterium lutimaris TaxID=388278 RepID=A0A2T3J3K8_9GAMM|nr:LysE family translocator [Photobacterium lutimaris]PSU35874.1 lysine transporter LysE [Photobacterium lutimaris]TDR78946.1 threonine/homoserine/homoserine lactone efflux protein [Photobacterium lutimaris]